MTLRARLALLLAGLLLLAGCGGGGSEAAGPARPTALPDVTLAPLRASDEPIDLGSLKGPAVVNLWANWCGPCRKDMPLYEAYSKAHADVRVIGVNALDTQRGRAIAVARRTGVTYPLVVDPDQAIKAIGLPRLLLVDARGKVAWSGYLQIKSVGELEALVRKHLGTAG